MQDPPNDSWPEWLGGLVLVAVDMLPTVVVVELAGHRSLAAGLVSIGSVAAGLGLLALLAPLVGCRRRRALIALLPFGGLVFSWQIGTALIRMTRTPQPLDAASAYSPVDSSWPF